MERTRAWIEKHPLQRASHLLVRAAIFDGTLVRPSVCSRCNEQTLVVAHHEDYERPLDVVWLCRWCHYCVHLGLLGLPVPTERKHRVPPPRTPVVREPGKRLPGRPFDASYQDRERRGKCTAVTVARVDIASHVCYRTARFAGGTRCKTHHWIDLRNEKIEATRLEKRRRDEQERADYFERAREAQRLQEAEAQKMQEVRERHAREIQERQRAFVARPLKARTPKTTRACVSVTASGTPCARKAKFETDAGAYCGSHWGVELRNEYYRQQREGR